jgi:putative hydrolase of the HAD superfamily
MTITTIALDLSGVMFTKPADWRPFAYAAAELGVAEELLRRVLWHGPDVEAANVGALTAEQYAARAATRVGVSAERMFHVIDQIWNSELNAELHRGVAALKREPGVRVIACTNNWSFLSQQLAKHPIDDFFDDVVNSADVGACKPDRRIYDVLIERAGCAAGHVLFVDDTPENVAAANALGIVGIHHVSNDRTLGLLREAVGAGR